MRILLPLLLAATLLPGQTRVPKKAATPRTLPANTAIHVRLIDTIDSSKATEGQTFAAALTNPLPPGGVANANATVRLINLEKSGKFKGQTGLAVVLDSVVLNGRTVNVETGTVTRTSGSQGKNTALKTGIGAGVGAAIGAIAGGGKGAAIGAGVGGAAGAASQIFTKGQKVQIPSETVLSFTTSSATRY